MKPTVAMLRGGFTLDLSHDWFKEVADNVEFVVSFDVESRRYRTYFMRGGVRSAFASLPTLQAAVQHLNAVARSAVP